VRGVLLRAALALAAAGAPGCSTRESALEGPPRPLRPRDPAVRAGDPHGLLPAVATGAEEAARILEAARAAGALTLEDCVRLTLATQEDLLLLEEDVLQSRLARDLALSGILPDVSMRVRHERQDPVTISIGGSPTSTEPVRSAWSVHVFQPIFQGLRELHAIRSADLTGEALGEDRRDLRRRLALSVARAFFVHAEAESEIRAVEEALKRDEGRVAEMEARAGQGLARRTEVLLQISRQETTRAALVQARERRDATRVILETLTGVSIDLPLEAPTDPAPPVPPREEALASAIRARPDLRAADRRVEAAGAELDVAQSQRWPVLAAEGNWYLDRWNHSQFAEETRWDMQLLLDFPLYTGGEIQASERIASSRQRQRALERAAVLRRIVEEVDTARVQLDGGRERLEALRANERFARENLDLIQEEYRQGLATNLEVFTAQTQLLDAVVALERQAHQTRLDALELDLAMGKDDPAAGAPKEKP